MWNAVSSRYEKLLVVDAVSAPPRSPSLSWCIHPTAAVVIGCQLLTSTPSLVQFGLTDDICLIQRNLGGYSLHLLGSPWPVTGWYRCLLVSVECHLHSITFGGIRLDFSWHTSTMSREVYHLSLTPSFVSPKGPDLHRNGHSMLCLEDPTFAFLWGIYNFLLLWIQELLPFLPSANN